MAAAAAVGTACGWAPASRPGGRRSATRQRSSQRRGTRRRCVPRNATHPAFLRMDRPRQQPNPNDATLMCEPHKRPRPKVRGLIGVLTLAHTRAHARPCQLTPSESVHLHVDHAMGGVGGDTGWSRSVRPPYRVAPGTHRWSLVLRPFGELSSLRRAPDLPSDWRLPLGPPVLQVRGRTPLYEPLGRARRFVVCISGLPRAERALVLLVALLVALLAHAVAATRGGA
eukprot:5197175-Prymnesium_polylepis.1